jgi:hypothetical protein
MIGWDVVSVGNVRKAWQFESSLASVITAENDVPSVRRIGASEMELVDVRFRTSIPLFVTRQATGRALIHAIIMR